MATRRARYRPHEATPRELSEHLQMAVVVTDFKVTRRQRIHYAVGPGGLGPFHAKSLLDVLDWLDDHDTHQAALMRHRVDGDLEGVVIRVSPFSPKEQ